MSHEQQIFRRGSRAHFVLRRRDDDATDARPAEFSEPTREEILREALARPIETVNQGARRRAAEREQRIAAQRAERETTIAETIASLEARLRRDNGTRYRYQSYHGNFACIRCTSNTAVSSARGISCGSARREDRRTTHDKAAPFLWP